MSKIFIISNTNFNISKGLSHKQWEGNITTYFDAVFIPYLVKNVKPNDILVHLGNLTYKSRTIDLNTLKIIQDTFEKISNILPMYIIKGENDKLSLNILRNFENINIIDKPTQIEINSQRFVILPINTKIDDFDNLDGDYCFFNFDYKNSKNKDIILSKLDIFDKCYNGFYSKNGLTKNIKNLASPYNIDTDSKKGVIVLDTHTNKDKFILNKTSPNFKKITINNESDLELPKSKKDNDYIELDINKNILINNKAKLEMVLSKNNITNVIYSDEDILKDKEDILELDNDSLSLKEMVEDYINKSDSKHKNKLLEEFNNIVKLNKK